MATIYDVALEAKVSPATVSRVLNGNDVTPDLAERVRAAVERLEYRPNSVARSLRRRRSAVWGLIISDIENPFFTEMVRGVEDVAQASGYSVVLCNSDEDLTKEARYVDVIVDERMAGAIVSPASERESDFSSLLERGISVVGIDRRLGHDGADTVLVDNLLGAGLATGHLLEQGWRRVACITGQTRVTTAAERLEGYRRALGRARVRFDSKLVVEADFKQEGGRRAALQLLDRAKPPDALFVANNLMCLGALEALRERGLELATDIGLASFDDMAWAELLRPRLTTVAQPTYEMGREAARLLLARIHGDGGAPRQVVLAPTLHVRDSSLRTEVAAAATAAAQPS